MAPTNRKPGGWVLPGHRYLGPFNPIENGEPVNAADAAARRHDLKYDQYLKEGKNPYLYFNKADSDFLEDFESDRFSAGGSERACLDSNERSHRRSTSPRANRTRGDLRRPRSRGSILRGRRSASSTLPDRPKRPRNKR
uniref:Truncated capsid protein VP1 n=1 Tax=Porcine bocavirus 1 TaxID=1048219 RepID=L0CSX6_9VIRU|nr:truncated capsid protein VP1 [Porcine bocavirus 1]